MKTEMFDLVARNARATAYLKQGELIKKRKKQRIKDATEVIIIGSLILAVILIIIYHTIYTLGLY